jgi:hypothetical protein
MKDMDPKTALLIILGMFGLWVLGWLYFVITEFMRADGYL